VASAIVPVFLEGNDEIRITEVHFQHHPDKPNPEETAFTSEKQSAGVFIGLFS